MYPPSQGLNLDIAALSGISGSISIACWVVVFSPQIIENFRRSSAEGLSVVFIFVWLLGDVFNILGAVLQGVLPTMTILAIYYTLADIVLLLQCFYYEGFTLKDKVKRSDVQSNSNGNAHHEHSALLRNEHTNSTAVRSTELNHDGTSAMLRDRLLSVDGTHLSPATPMVADASELDQQEAVIKSRSTFKAVIFNVFSVILVCAAGILGWWLSNHHTHHSNDKSHHKKHDIREFNVLGQVFGYICALLYLGSRMPQLLLNYRRKSTEGISMLFFLFACIGNLTYVLSILAYGPVCENRKHCKPGEASGIYARYIAVNFSWLLGSFGTLLLDAGVFVQYFMYREDPEESDTDTSDTPPLLSREERD